MPPLLRVGQGSVGVVRVLQVRDHREVDESRALSRDQDPVDVTLGGGEDGVLRLQRSVIAAGRFVVGLDEGGGSGDAPGAHPHVDRLGAQGRQQTGHTGAPHPVGEKQGIAAPHQQRVGVPDRWHPSSLLDARQRRQLQDPQRSPTQFSQRRGTLAADRSPRHTGPAGEGVDRGGDEQGVGLGDRFAQQVDQRVVDAAVLDPGRCEESSHVPTFLTCTLVLPQLPAGALVRPCRGAGGTGRRRAAGWRRAPAASEEDPW